MRNIASSKANHFFVLIEKNFNDDHLKEIELAKIVNKFQIEFVTSIIEFGKNFFVCIDES